MTRRFVTLGDGRRVSLGAYVRAWRKCLALPSDTFVGRCPDGMDGRAGDALRMFRSGLDERINRHDAAHGRGRKWSAEWQREAIQAAVRFNTPRLIIDWLPPFLRHRFAHRLRQRRAA